MTWNWKNSTDETWISKFENKQNVDEKVFFLKMKVALESVGESMSLIRGAYNQFNRWVKLRQVEDNCQCSIAIKVAMS